MMNLAEGLDIAAAARPDHPAIVAEGTVETHRDFALGVRRWAAHLDRHIPGERRLVGVCLEDGPAHARALYALARAGIAILPLDIRWAAEEKRRVVAHFAPDAVLVVPGESAAFDRPTVVVDADFEAEAARADPFRAFPNDPDAPFVLSLSSGTTGRPKGPLVTHRQFFRRFMTHWIDLGLNGRDRFVVATPFYFGGGRTFLMSVLFSGGTVILRPPPFEAEDLADTIERERATSLFLVPTQLRRVLDLPEERRAAFRRLNLLFSSGAPLAAHERRAIRDTVCPNFFEYYASTEGGGVSLLGPADIDRRPDSVGRPVFGVSVEVVDDAHRPLPHGETGLLRYRGPGCASAYHRDPGASAEAFHDGWFYPGDLASIDAEGFVTLRGRRKDMIIRGGVNIHPADVEAVLGAHPSVAEAACVGQASRRMGEEVAAFVRLRIPAATEDLVAWCRERLAPYKVPRTVVAVDDLPRNSAGKVLKAELAARLPALD